MFKVYSKLNRRIIYLAANINYLIYPVKESPPKFKIVGGSGMCHAISPLP